VLVERSLDAFLASVGSTREPVPAGGSVTALSGAAAAALLALVCGVRGKRAGGVFGPLRARADALRTELTRLVDEDARAYREFIAARRRREDVAGAAERAARVPLRIAQACSEVVALAAEMRPRVRGALSGDVRTAQLLGRAACAAAVGLAEQDVKHIADPAARARLLGDLAAVRLGFEPGRAADQ
jgi:formiminotetrahydrofolate cyclodeaminase